MLIANQLRSDFFEMVAQGNLKGVQVLIKYGFDVNVIGRQNDAHHLQIAPDHSFESTQAWATIHNNEAMINVLKQENARNTRNYTALMVAVSKGHKKIVELLIESGVNVNSLTNGS